MKNFISNKSNRRKIGLAIAVVGLCIVSFTYGSEYEAKRMEV